MKIFKRQPYWLYAGISFGSFEGIFWKWGYLLFDNIAKGHMVFITERIFSLIVAIFCFSLFSLFISKEAAYHVKIALEKHILQNMNVYKEKKL